MTLFNKSMLTRPILLMLILVCELSLAQQKIPLYPAVIPNSTGSDVNEVKEFNPEVDTLISHVSKPTLTFYAPPIDKRNGTSVIICPGGGYHYLLIEREGNNIARAFNKIGVTAFVLKYRLPDDKIMINKSLGSFQDAQKAIQIVREKANEFNINPDKIGIMGFSAGGHLAATAGTHFNDAVIENNQHISLRPDFMLLIYPVISFTDSICHPGSRNNLLGKSPSKELIDFFSNEKNISTTTPATFIAHANDDAVVPVENSLIFYEQLKNKSVPAELHIYSKGGHGFLKQPSFNEWFGRCRYWMKENGLL